MTIKPVRRGHSNPDVFRERLDAIIDRRHGLVRLAVLMPWSAFEGNPYDGHTLKASAAKTEGMTGVTIQRLHVDEGCRGHGYDGEAKVMISGDKRGLAPTMKRELKRRSAIEPMIGHARNDGRLGRNHRLGSAGDKINTLLAAGHNLRLVLARPACLSAQLIAAGAGLMTKGSQIPIVGHPRAVFPCIGVQPSGLTNSGG